MVDVCACRVKVVPIRKRCVSLRHNHFNLPQFAAVARPQKQIVARRIERQAQSRERRLFIFSVD